MKTYPRSNDTQTETIWRPTGGPGEAIHIATFEAEAEEGVDANPMTVTLKAEGSTELSKAGLRRVLLKVSTTVPQDQCGCASTALGSTSLTGTKAGMNIPVSAHCVIMAPAAAVRFARDNPSGSVFNKVVEAVIRHLLAILGGSYYGSASDNIVDNGNTNNPILAGLLGAEPLDPVSGVYGVETRS
jgi:hypothetical protein